jgi:type II secretory ATPase GspE/PulE/Tfp pilus assembly ATPase PilB-like protein
MVLGLQLVDLHWQYKPALLVEKRRGPPVFNQRIRFAMALCKVLVPFDFSQRALQTAYKLAASSELELHLVHVLAEMDSESDHNILQKLQSVVLPSIEMKSTIHRQVLRGNTHQEILRCANQHGIDFIVIGTRGRSGFLQLAIGSVAQAIVKKSTCPVVVVNREENGAKVDLDPSDTGYLKLKTEDSAAVDMISRAISLRATDIHIDPIDDKEYQIRLRIDGVVKPYCLMDSWVAEHLLHQCVTLAKVDHADPFRPKEGRIQLPLSISDVEVRMTTAPVARGQAMALRLFAKENVYFPLEQLGFPLAGLATVRQILQGQEGLVLVTGPTGSGKSTTVYSMLETFGEGNRNIVSIEDPVEFGVPFVRQMNVDEKHGITMSSGLRTLLRMDPDVVFIGEIRDMEAASIALRAASSGVFVFSSLHARDAAGSITALRDYGVSSKSIANGLSGIVNQRLVRRLCLECRRAIPVDDRLRSMLAKNEQPEPTQVFEPVGCAHCRGTGFFGRCGIFEIVSCAGTLSGLIGTGAVESDIRSEIRQQGVVSLAKDALTKVANGITSLDEALMARWF